MKEKELKKLLNEKNYIRIEAEKDNDFYRIYGITEDGKKFLINYKEVIKKINKL